jgi:hypothetical protein
MLSETERSDPNEAFEQALHEATKMVETTQTDTNTEKFLNRMIDCSLALAALTGEQTHLRKGQARLVLLDDGEIDETAFNQMKMMMKRTAAQTQ